MLQDPLVSVTVDPATVQAWAVAFSTTAPDASRASGAGATRAERAPRARSQLGSLSAALSRICVSRLTYGMPGWCPQGCRSTHQFGGYPIAGVEGLSAPNSSWRSDREREKTAACKSPE